MQAVEQQSKKILIFSILVAFLLILTMLYQSRSILLVEEEDKEEITKVGILTTDQIIDQSWGSLAYKGQLKIEEEFSVHTTLKSELRKTDSMEQATIEMIDEEMDLIIGHGREFSNTFTRLAENHPHIMFVTIHGTAVFENQAVYTFDQGEIEYFAALAATLKTESQKIGIIDADNERDKYPQFEEGLQYYDSEITSYYDIIPDRNDGDRALEIMEEMIENDVDVVYSKGNAFNRHIIERAKMEDIYVIGYIDDQSYMARDHVLTSVINDVPRIYSVIMNDYFSEEGISSGERMLTEKDGIYRLSPLGPMFTADEREYIHDEINKYDQGEISF
ncbi:BMP family ABC transporter substrate-binding protein [Salipaludibacillus daqingensis]|uniref:BMP family ABC transporter substrate-binding protein n=1 Tax=Salipaludibacillus daqingensis TaxID=3041001 RepID=UPI002473FBA3|nr:BMP family ABC transporter substrate-binding protein [Salipaludibacillus daqingensis]